VIVVPGALRNQRRHGRPGCLDRRAAPENADDSVERIEGTLAAGSSHPGPRTGRPVCRRRWIADSPAAATGCSCSATW
jgi:hypothetical protein